MNTLFVGRLASATYSARMRTSWPRIALLYAVGVIAAGQLGIVAPLVPALQRDLGLSLALGGMAVSIVTLVGAALGFVLTILKIVFVVGAILFVVWLLKRNGGEEEKGDA